LLGLRSISRKPPIRPRASRRRRTLGLRRRRRTRRRKCRWCGRCSRKPSVLDCGMACTSLRPGPLSSSPVGRCWSRGRSSSSLGARDSTAAGMRSYATRGRGSRGGLVPPTRPPRHAQAARKSALPTRRDARPRARPTSAAPLQVPNPRELARDARQGG